MCATAANLIERVLPEVPLRQWVLTFPFSWRRRLAHDGALLSTLTRVFVDTVLAFYGERGALGRASAKSGAVTVVQRTSTSRSRSASKSRFPPLHSAPPTSKLPPDSTFANVRAR